MFWDLVQTFFALSWPRALLWGAGGVAALLFMEPWAGIVHESLWHRGLWRFHRSHHAPGEGPFEGNDLLSASHAPVAIALILTAVLLGPGRVADLLFGVGAGMTFYGAGYLLFHDGMVHGRLPVTWLAKVGLFAQIRDAHQEHHRAGGAPFGFFLGPWELSRERARALRSK